MDFQWLINYGVAVLVGFVTVKSIRMVFWDDDPPARSVPDVDRWTSYTSRAEQTVRSEQAEQPSSETCLYCGQWSDHLGMCDHCGAPILPAQKTNRDAPLIRPTALAELIK